MLFYYHYAYIINIVYFQWFIANYTYQISLEQIEDKIVIVLSSTSSLFTLFLAAFFPSNGGDKLTLSKLAAVLVSFFGLVSCKFIRGFQFRNKI